MSMENWIEIEIREVSELVTDGTHQTPKYTATGVKFISVKDIYDDIVHFNACRYISKEEHEVLIKRCKPEFEDLLITKSGTIGRLALVPKEEFSLFVSVALIKLQLAKKFLLPKWVFYAVKYHILGINISQDIKGGLLKNYHLEDLRLAKIHLAPLPEQRAIVAKIEQLFSELDNGIANLKAAKAKLDIYRQAVLKKAFEGEMTRAWRERQTDLPTAEELLGQIKIERQRYYEEQLREWELAVADWERLAKMGRKPSKPKKLEISNNLLNDDLPELPEHWAWISNDYGSTINPSKPFLSDETEVSFIPMPHVEEETGRYTYTETRKYKDVASGYTGFREGDVIFAKITPCMENGKVAFVEKLINSVGFGSTEFHVARPAKSLNGRYLFRYLVQPFLRKDARMNMTGSAGQLRVPTDYFCSIPIPLCSPEEQIQVLQEIESRLSVCDNILANIDEGLEKAEALRQSILKKAFEGRLLSAAELEACRKEADWEPAAGLLARIRKGK